MAKILIVDDEPDVCTILQTAFRIKGHEIKVAYNGEQALDLLKNYTPELLITDMQMPKMTGQELYAELQRNSTTRDIPVIVITSLTSDSSMDDEEWCRRMGVADFVSKPFEPMEIVQRAEKVLEPENQ